MYKALSRSQSIHDLRDYLYDKKIASLKKLTKDICNIFSNEEESIKAIILLLRLAAAARESKGSTPIIPHRLHFLARTPDKIVVCLNPDCTGPDEYKYDRLGCVQPATDTCQHCDALTLDLHRCVKCGQEALIGHGDMYSEILERGELKQQSNLLFLLLQPAGGEDERIVIDLKTREYSCRGELGIVLYKANRLEGQIICPNCKAIWANSQSSEDEPSRPTCISVDLNESLALSVLGETILFNLPPWPNDQRLWKPGDGRRMLCFSDSRKEAARLGPVLSYHHEWWLIRKAMAETLQKTDMIQLKEFLFEEMQELKKKLEKASPELRPHIKNKWKEACSQYQRSIQGLSFNDFVIKLKDHPSLIQFLHRESGEKHKADRWGQNHWEDNAKRIKEAAEPLAAKELDSTSLSYDGLEAMGMVEILYPGIANLEPPSELLGKIGKKESRDKLKEIWPSITALLLDTVRRQGCMAWANDDKSKIWEDHPTLISRWCSKSEHGWSLISFIGNRQRQFSTRQLRLWFMYHVLNACGVKLDESAHLESECLSTLFDQLHQENEKNNFDWLRFGNRETKQKTNSQSSFQILLDKLALRVPTRIYKCQNTGKFWPRHVLNVVPDKNYGALEELDANQADQDPRWGRVRRELNDPIFSMGLWGEEHTAQLSATENRRLQDLFKNGIRNILSSTTTMELGIDIGGLNGVLLGNVPPSRANHLQRAGRAGRRSDGSAVVAAFARRRRFDHEVFHHFDQFLERKMRVPRVFLDREKITRRHLRAWLLGEFMPIEQKTGAMDAFGWMGGWTGITTPSYWNRNSASKPEWSIDKPERKKAFIRFLDCCKNNNDLHMRITSLVNNTQLISLSENDPWIDFLDETKHDFEKAMNTWVTDINHLCEAWSNVPEPASSENRPAARSQANAIRYQIKARCEITLIEWLANERFLPRYGFPINLQKLNVCVPSEIRKDRSKTHPNYRLERSSMLAISEYIPGSEILAGGKTLISHGLMKHWTGENINDALGLNHFLLTCDQGHTYLASKTNAPCPECQSAPPQNVLNLMFPRFGYTTAAWEPPKRGTDIDRVGEMIVSPVQETFNNCKGEDIENSFGEVKGLNVMFVDDAELLIYNKGENQNGFAVCTLCGYAESETGCDESKPPSSSFPDHASIYNPRQMTRCWSQYQGNPPVLRNRVIAARERTEMLRLEWPDVLNETETRSIGKALQLAGCHEIEVDTREVGIKPLIKERENHYILFYDTTPGGSGHCREFKRLGRKWLESARNILKGDEKHDSTCYSACLDCILDFDSCYYADHLNRKTALEKFMEILD